MIVKILGNKGGGSAGAAIDYMLGKERDREGAVLLSGDPDLTARLADNLDFQNRYTVGVLSFEEANIEEQQKLSNEKFIVHFESLPQLQRNKINEQVKAEVSQIPILGKNFGENSYKDIMFRAYFKTVMNLNN